MRSACGQLGFPSRGNLQVRGEMAFDADFPTVKKENTWGNASGHPWGSTGDGPLPHGVTFPHVEGQRPHATKSISQIAWRRSGPHPDRGRKERECVSGNRVRVSTSGQGT